MRQINLFNGDCAYEAWLKSGLCSGRSECCSLVWRENYLQGTIPRTEDLSEFNRLRAIELHQIAPEKPEAEILEELTRMNQCLLSLTEEDRLTLWFDVCPFDRSMLARVFYLLNRLAGLPEIKLIYRDVAWSTEDFLRHQHDGVILSKNDLAYGAAEWLAFRDGKAAETCFARFEFLPTKEADDV